MKKIISGLIISTFIVSISACSNSVSQINSDTIDQNISAQSVTKDNVYPFEVQKDFFPLYNQTQWNYDVYDQNNKLVTSLTKTLDVNNENSLELDSKNKYYVVGLKKTYGSQASVKDTEPFEFIRRKDNQLAFGKLDDITYYPDNRSTNTSKSYDPYLFRPFITFPSNKLETVKVKAGTFQCIKSEFTLKLDKYTIWYAQGIGEVKRLKEGYFNSLRYELSSYNNATKIFVLAKEKINLKDAPSTVVTKANQLKEEYLKLNSLPLDLFDSKGSNLFTDITVIKDNNKKTFEITYLNRSTSTKDNVNFVVKLNSDSAVANVSVFGDNNAKPTYQGKVVDKLPTLK